MTIERIRLRRGAAVFLEKTHPFEKAIQCLMEKKESVVKRVTIHIMILFYNQICNRVRDSFERQHAKIGLTSPMIEFCIILKSQVLDIPYPSWLSVAIL